MASVELCFDTSLRPCEIQISPSFEQRAEAFARSDLVKKKALSPFDPNPIVLVFCG